MMYPFKHLRGKHDQRDHGRRVVGGSRTQAATRGLSTLSESDMAEARKKALKIARDAEEWMHGDRGSATAAEKLRDVRELMDSTSKFMDSMQKNLRQVRRGALVPKIPGDTPEKQRKFIEGILFASVAKFDHHREQHNNLVATIQAERQADRQAERQALRDSARSKRQQEQAAADRRKKSPNPPPKPITTTPFESLNEVGLLGWARQRPPTPPNYAAFDRGAENPDWVSKLEDEYAGESRAMRNFLVPRGLRNITQTPEGGPMRTVIPKIPGRPSDGATSLSDLSYSQLRGDSRRPVHSEKPWRLGVYNAGEEIFRDQNSSGDAQSFWEQTPPPPTWWNKQSRRGLDYAVRTYGTSGYTSINAYMRNDRDAQSLRNIDQEARRILADEQRPKDEQEMTTLERRRKKDELLDRLREVEETQRDIATLDAGMRPAPQTVFTRRGVGPDVFSRMQQHLKVGDRFTDDAFTSVSLTPTFNWAGTASEGNSPMTNIILTEGTPALWTDGHALRESENEVIVGRGVTYEVVSTDNERGWVLRTIPPDGRYTPKPVSAYGNDDPLAETRQYLRSP